MSTELRPARLRCEYLTNPLGIDVVRPRLSWIVESEQRGQRQSAYQLLVAGTREHLDADHGDLLDSAKVASSQTAHVVYSGEPLHSGMRCWWKVRVWDKDGVVSAYAQAAWWDMGLLQPDDWQATWIGLEQAIPFQPAPKEQDAGPRPGIDLIPAAYLRRDLRLDRPVRQARLYATARGVYQLSINGQRAGDQVLAPGWTDYDDRIQYQTYDVTDLLQAGDNALGAILGSGWYCGYVGFGGVRNHYGSRPQLLLQLVLEDEEGEVVTIVSDGTWLGSTGPIVFSDMLMGEAYDARSELAGWDAPGFDDSGWHPVAVEDLDNVPLVADRAEPVRVTQEIVPVAISEPAPGIFIFDLGQNIAGWVRLKVTGISGQRIQLRFVEMLNPDGTIYTTNLRSARATDVYILKGDQAEEVFEPHFTFHGFRYVEVTGYVGRPPLDMVIGCVVQSAMSPVGTFVCSDSMVNQLQQNIIWGQRGNFLSIPTDCPQRDERLGWLGDAQIFARTASQNFDVAAFFTKWMVDVEDAQSPADAFPDVAPRLVAIVDGAPAWGDAGVIIPWTLHRVYGDTQIVERHWDAMVRWMNYLHLANPGHVRTARLGNNYGDWLSIDADTPREVLATAYYAYDARLMADMAAAIGRPDEARQYAARFEAIKAAFNRAFVASDGRIAGNTQSCYVLALHMDLLSPEHRVAAARYLTEDIERKGWHLSTGFVGVGYLCPVLTEAGYLDVAYRLLNNDTFPSWGYSIKHGATTIWERWDGWTEEHGFQTPAMNSFNHYSMGSVGEWLYRYVAGIDLDPQYPGYEHIMIRPHPGGGLTHARAEYDSIRGRISSAWTVDVDTLSLAVSVPANTTATIYLPTNGNVVITESGSLASEVPGIQYKGHKDGRAVFEVESGTYQFVQSPIGSS